MKIKDLTLNKKLLLLNAVPVAIFLVVGIIAFRSVSSMKQTGEWVNHTHEVIEKAQNLVGAAVDMETGMRGYLLAGKEDFLDPYNNGKESFLKLATDLQETVSDNPTQVKRLDSIQKTIFEWQRDVVEPVIALRREIGDAKTMNDMADLVGDARGKEYFDSFRGQIAEFIGREETLLVQRQEKMDQIAEDGQGNVAEFRENVKWVEHTYVVIAKARLMLAAAVDMETGMRGYLLAGEDQFLGPYETGSESFAAVNRDLGATVSDNPVQVALLGKMDETIQAWRGKVVESMIELRREIGDSETMDDMAKRVGEARGKKYFDSFRKDIADFIAMESELLVVRAEDLENAVAFTQSAVTTGSIAAVAAICGVIFFMSRSVVKPLEVIMRGLGSASEQVSDSSSFVAQTSQDMSKGATTQAAGVEEISSSLEEMSAMTEKNSEGAVQANELMKKVGSTVSVSKDQMQNLTGSMKAVSESSEKTSKIVQTIDEIAFQTNILALNAAVEAARAGEAGSGFAVVADEVRSLAMRAAEAAKDTGTLIEESVKSIKESESIAGQTSVSFEEVAERVTKVASLVEAIAESSQEQALGIRQVSSGVREIDEVVQRSAASSEENASSAEELSAQAQQLRDYSMELVGLVNGANTVQDTVSRSSSESFASRSTASPTVSDDSWFANDRGEKEPSVDLGSFTSSDGSKFDQANAAEHFSEGRS